VRGAKPFLGTEVWRWGSQYLWGDGVPLLRPWPSPPRGGKKYGWKSARERALIPYPLARFIAENS
jgi:hypothetical protein